jgi:hypothetical protein
MNRASPDWRKRRSSLLKALRTAPSIERYEIAELLAMFSLEEPPSIIDLLTARVEAIESGACGVPKLRPRSLPCGFLD